MADSHTTYIAKQCVKNVHKSWGIDAREKLGQTLFSALVAREVVSIVMMQTLDLCNVEQKAHAAEYMQEAACLALKLADPE